MKALPFGLEDFGSDLAPVVLPIFEASALLLPTGFVLSAEGAFTAFLG